MTKNRARAILAPLALLTAAVALSGCSAIDDLLGKRVTNSYATVTDFREAGLVDAA